MTGDTARFREAVMTLLEMDSLPGGDNLAGALRMLRTLCYVRDQAPAAVTVDDVWLAHDDASRSAAHRHLSALRKAGLVTWERGRGYRAVDGAQS
jgi:hypothetical protein